MAIRRFNPDTDTIKPGDWVCFEYFQERGKITPICSEPHLVSRLLSDNKFGYWLNLVIDEYQDEGFAFPSYVGFVGQTKEELLPIAAISDKHHKLWLEQLKNVHQQANSEIDALIAGVAA